MDLYLPGADLHGSLQDMIDCDMESSDWEFQPADPVCPCADLDMGSLDSDFGLKSCDPLFSPLDNLEMEMTDELHSVGSWMNLSSTNNSFLDLENSIMVNPSAVLPARHPTPSSSSAGAEETNAELHHSSVRSSTPVLKADAASQQSISSADTRSSSNCSVTITDGIVSSDRLSPVASYVSVSSPGCEKVNASTSSSVQLTFTTSSPNDLSTSTHSYIRSASSIATQSGVTSVCLSQPVVTTTTAAALNYGQVRSPSYVNIVRFKNGSRSKREPLKPPEEKLYPKPAYSYSCLIALALKNSMTGSLPVSEIYSFMCEHFPYFRTAPNGWKNSVRHNLSLNKCFEKIEKPVASNNNQRKGCLWALNPSKAHKMDEEVQKWSKKDLKGITDAMTYPDILVELEKGDIKFESLSGASSCSEDEDEEEEIVEPVKLASETTIIRPVKATFQIVSAHSLGSPIIGHAQKLAALKTSLAAGNVKFSPTTAALRIPGITAGKLQPAIMTTKRFAGRVTSSDETGFILPDSTKSDISIQHSATVIDDLGSELIKDESVTEIISPRGIIVRKIPSKLAQLKTGSRSYIYTPSLTSPHHQGLNRLVLTNGKIA